MIHRRHYPDHDLIVHTVVGDLDEGKLRAAGRALYDMDPPPRLSLWDLTRASIASFTADRMRALQYEFSQEVPSRRDGRTALVAAEDLTFGLARQYQGYAEALGLPMKHRVFRSTSDALEWLGVDVAIEDEDHEEWEVLSG